MELCNDELFLRIGEAAAFLGVTPVTLREWANTRTVPCYRDEDGVRWFYCSDLAILRMAIERGLKPAKD